MEITKKCSNKKHSELNAISYCLECNLFLCNKCSNHHNEYTDTHHINYLSKNNQEIFTGLCQELNHKNKLEFYFKNHNKLCCAACLCKIKGNSFGQHFDCDVCLIKEIKEEKKSKLNENLKYLEELSKNINESMKKLKEIYEKINESKEEIKLKISKIFTKIRNVINEREDQLLLELDNIYVKSYFKEDIIKKGEKIPNLIKSFLEKGKLLNNEWNDDNNLIEKINDYLNIENNIKNIIEINELIDKYNSKKLNIKFLPEDEQITGLTEQIKKFGEIFNEEDEKFKFKFRQANNFNISKNGFMATKYGSDGWNCAIIGDKEIPKERISKWKIKINKNVSNNYNDFYIGIGPKIFKGNLYNECWSIFSAHSKIAIQMKVKNSNYNNQNIILKEGDIIEIIVDRKLGNLSFAINDINCGIACSTIPKDEELYPTIILYEQNLSVEII